MLFFVILPCTCIIFLQALNSNMLMILGKRWNLTKIANINDSEALFCYLPPVSDLNGLELKNIRPAFFKFTFLQSISILSNFYHLHFIPASKYLFNVFLGNETSI